MRSVERNLASLRGIPSLVWGPGQQRRLEMILRHTKLSYKTKLSRALVNGCGVGQYAFRIVPYFHQVVGIDIEPAYLDKANSENQSLALSCAPCEQLPLGDETFDLILSHEVLEHVQDDRAAMEEMVRVIRPGGYIVLFVPNRWFPFETHGFYWDRQYYWGNIPLINYLPSAWRNRLVPHVRIYDKQSLCLLIHDLPVQIVSWTHIWPGFDTLGTIWPAGKQLFSRLRSRCEASPLAFLGISHFLVMRCIK